VKIRRQVAFVIVLAAVETAFSSSGVGVKPPNLQRFTAPIYSGTGVDEKVTAVVTVNAEGAVVDVTTKDAAETRFADAVVTAVRKWRFVPGMRGGRVIPMKIWIPFSFDSQSSEVTVDLGQYFGE
jgi:TonB family protein